MKLWEGWLGLGSGLRVEGSPGFSARPRKVYILPMEHLIHKTAKKHNITGLADVSFRKERFGIHRVEGVRCVRRLSGMCRGFRM